MSDYCYSFPVFKRVFAQAEQMDAMLAKAGVDPLAVIRRDGGASWYEARTRCIDCVWDQQCRNWLRGSRLGPVEPSPDFCPNRELLRDCGPCPS